MIEIERHEGEPMLCTWQLLEIMELKTKKCGWKVRLIYADGAAYISRETFKTADAARAHAQRFVLEHMDDSKGAQH